MNDENNLDLETFQVYPDEEPERKTAAPTEKKSKKVLGKAIPQSPFSGGKKSNTKSNTKGTQSTGNLMDKITPTIACVIGVAIVVVYIAVDLAGML